MQKQRQLLAIYSICGISGAQNIAYYADSIRSLLSQVGFTQDQFKICVSSCLSTDYTKNILKGFFADIISYDWVEENVPLSVTVNHSVDAMVSHFGEFDGYLYIDSGITFWDPSWQWRALYDLWTVYKSGPYAICAAMPSNDDGGAWWGIQYKQGEDKVLPIGKATNMHCQIFSPTWKRTYPRLLPDIFASHTMESVFTFQAAAIKEKVVVTNKAHLLHSHSMDGASIGSRQPDPDRIPASNIFETGGLLFKTKKTMDERFQEGHQYGFGYEECKPYWPHDPMLFDAEGFAKDERLAPFLAKELYLSRDEFDYSKLKHTFEPGRD